MYKDVNDMSMDFLSMVAVTSTVTSAFGPVDQLDPSGAFDFRGFSIKPIANLGHARTATNHFATVASASL